MSDGESIAGREREVTFHTTGVLTREQVEEVFNAVYWHGDQQGAKQCKVLDGIDALRATIEQQAQELGRCKSEKNDAVIELYRKLDAKDAELTASQARCREMEERKDAAYLERNHLVAALARCFPSGIRKTAIEGWSDDWHGCVYIDLPAGQISYHYHDAQADLFFGLPAYDKPYDGHTKEQVHDRLQSAQLQAILAAREARIAELEDWQKIVLGSGTEQETVIRMAANEYTKTAVQCWKDHTKKIEAERDAAVQEAGRLREVLEYYAQTAIGARAIAALKAQQAAGDSPAGQTPPNFREAP